MKTPGSLPGTVIAIFVLALLLTAALIAPWLAPYDGSAITGDLWQPMSAQHWLGTDNLGRDLFSRLLYGTRLTLLFAFAIALLAMIAGTLISFLAVSLGGRKEQVISRINDLFMSLPSLILSLVALAVLPQENLTLIVVLAAIEATRVYRLGYALAKQLSAMEYMEATLLAGESHRWRIFHEMLPNAWVPLLTEFGVRFGYCVLFVSTLSFLGLGVQPPAADWGSIVRENRDGILFGVSAAFYPAIAIALLVISTNMVVDALSRYWQRQAGGQ